MSPKRINDKVPRLLGGFFFSVMSKGMKGTGKRIEICRGAGLSQTERVFFGFAGKGIKFGSKQKEQGGVLRDMAHTEGIYKDEGCPDNPLNSLPQIIPLLLQG